MHTAFTPAHAGAIAPGSPAQDFCIDDEGNVVPGGIRPVSLTFEYTGQFIVSPVPDSVSDLEIHRDVPANGFVAGEAEVQARWRDTVGSSRAQWNPVTIGDHLIMGRGDNAEPSGFLSSYKGDLEDQIEIRIRPLIPVNCPWWLEYTIDVDCVPVLEIGQEFPGLILVGGSAG